ncbi:NADH-quinone oxidoreductase subunit L [Pontibacillus marinus]|uniref:NADH:ubiquinone oxidoreductase subunit L n=1 Tax=Pontibacillus marinus BH030004 = DSM 16465 TaxID=1385511 RepID=A0A0A5HUI0_9BACI|nr:NADH-quinone oxidoreductase subunit L [Pontibacillus marinus]KGX87297.1 NADH:ubiquinone oxidoreductase subunit L [Pontibacillus marinus BH030004 = DSM 16465]
MLEYAWIIPVFPLLSFVLLILLRQTVTDKSSYIGIGLSGVSLILSGVVLLAQMSQGNLIKSVSWLSIGNIELTVGYLVNPLNAMMLVLVSLVSFLVHIYSMGYMKEDSRLNVFYAYLGLFTFAMLALVLSPNLLQIYMFWELVGLGSFLLIGFYFYKKEARQAAKKAFIMTRIGDIGLLIGIILLFWQTGSLELTSIFAAVEAGAMEEGMITLIAILIFVGAIGKSGQFPLHSWLPDAMEGPTPVSALIHAATMVAAGVYLVATLFPLYEASETAMLVVATIGAFTAIFAATIALVQKDLKRVLAYSTVSQLGYMMLALGSAGYVAGVFHLMTHAFFKALLFLAAGSVIHAVHTQNIEKMGGLWKKMKWTGPLFLIGALAISGFPLLSGFFSKEEILLAAWGEGHYVLFVLALIAAFLTAFYMFRLFFMVFTSPAKTNNVVKESPKSMTFPMIVLGALAVVAGYLNTPWFGTFLGDWLTAGNGFVEAHHAEGPIWIMLVTILLSLGGIYLAYVIYHKKSLERDFLSSTFPIAYTVMYNRYFVDEFYQMTVGYGARALGYLGVFLEKYIVNVIASLCSEIVQGIGKQGSKLQNGQVQTYGAVVFVGLVIILAVAVMQGGVFQ